MIKAVHLVYVHMKKGSLSIARESDDNGEEQTGLLQSEATSHL